MSGIPQAGDLTGAPLAGAVTPSFWRERRVLVTGHNGFKGAWLCLWLQALGARVCGISLASPPTSPSLYELVGVGEGMDACFACDVRDPHALAQAVRRARAEVVIHMAAQPLVRQSLREPLETYAVNALGVASLLEALRESPDTEAVVVVTSDKCYAPSDSGSAHVEGDALGGEDPYSSSKACAELIVAAYRDSFFSTPTSARVASARAGNVIGGGDFSAERLLPDVFAAALRGEPVLLRNPDAVRPWQHVLSPLSGYLALAQALCEREGCERAWNFGPAAGDALAVRELVGRASSLWEGGIDWRIDEREHPPENPSLRLDSTRARVELGWQPLCTLEQGIASTVEWYRAYGAGEDLREATLRQLPRLLPERVS